MSILVSQKILDRIRDELSTSTESFLLISAYCKLPLVRYFDSCIANTGIEKKLVVRFRPDDIAFGASDLEIYPYCRDNGWKLYFRMDLHAKTYVFDRLRCIIGSANATGNGMNIGGCGNYEMATACELADKDVQALDLLLRGAVEMNDKLYTIMKERVDDQNSAITSSTQWPKEITAMFLPDYSLLFAEDFPACTHPASATNDDLLFLNLSCGATKAEIAQAMRSAKCYLWLLNLIKKQQSQEMYYGAITAALHNALLNDPKPYRKEVKQLLSNLLSWINELEIDELLIDRPNHSQRVRYISREV